MKKWLSFALILATLTPAKFVDADTKLDGELKAIMVLFMQKEAGLKSRIEVLENEKSALNKANLKLDGELKAIMVLFMQKEADLKSRIEVLENEKSALINANLNLREYMELIKNKSQSLENENWLLRSKYSETPVNEIEMVSLPQPLESPRNISAHKGNLSDPSNRISSTYTTSASRQNHAPVEGLDPFDLATSSDVRTTRDKKLKETSEEAIQIFKSNESNIEEWFENAYGYVIFPSVWNAGVGIGGAFGKGEVFESGKFIGEARLTQGTFGFQLGGQAYSEIIFFENQKNLQNFKDGVFALSAQSSAVIAAKGASANTRYERGIAVFTMAKGGIMVEASVGGQKYSFIPKD